MNNLNELIKDIAERHSVADVLDRLSAIMGGKPARVGFIGPFSSGKTSLINALLDTNLPVDIKPTTKSICIIEPDSSLESPAFFRQESDERTPVDFMKLTDIINGEASGDAVVRMPPQGALKDGIVFIDTPGIDSMGAEEAERTYEYLMEIDAAVVCISIEDGTLRKPVIDFLRHPYLQPIASKLVFAITKGDMKPPITCKIVEAEIVRQLEALATEGVLALGNLEGRIIVVSQESARDLLPEVLDRCFLSKLPELQTYRRDVELKRLAGDLCEILEVKESSLEFDGSQYEQAIAEADGKLASIEKQLERSEQTLSKTEGALRGIVFNTMKAHQFAVCRAEGEARQTALEAMLADVKDQVTVFAQAHAKDFRPDLSFCNSFGSSIGSSLEAIDKGVDVGVMAVTALVTMGTGGATSVAGNVAEAGAGAAAGKAGKLAKAAGKAGKAAGKTAKVMKCLGAVAKVIHAINPFAQVGDLVGGQLKDRSFGDVCSSASSAIAHNLCLQLQAPYEMEVLEPLRVKVAAAKMALGNQSEARKRGISDFREEGKSLREDVKALKAIG